MSEQTVAFKSKPNYSGWGAVVLGLFCFGSIGPATPTGFVVLARVGGAIFVLLGIASMLPGGYFCVKASSRGIEIWQYFLKAKTLKWSLVKGFTIKELKRKGRVDKRVAIQLEPSLLMDREFVLDFAFEIPAEEMLEQLTESLKRQHEVIPGESQ